MKILNASITPTAEETKEYLQSIGIETADLHHKFTEMFGRPVFNAVNAEAALQKLRIEFADCECEVSKIVGGFQYSFSVGPGSIQISVKTRFPNRAAPIIARPYFNV